MRSMRGMIMVRFDDFLPRWGNTIYEMEKIWEPTVIPKYRPGQEYLALRPKPRSTDLRSCSSRRGRS